MIRILYRHRTGSALAELPVEQLSNAITDKQLSLWIDMQAPTEDEAHRVLEKIFHFHPLAIEDAVKDSNVPKIDDYSNYLYIVFHTITAGGTRMDLHTDEIDCFLGTNYLLTMHDEPCTSIDKIWNLESHQRTGLARGPVMLLYELLDRQIDSYAPLIQNFEETLEYLGDVIFRNNGDNQRVALDDLLTAKSSALRLYRVFFPQRELLLRLASGTYTQIPNESRIYFRDLYDHHLHLSELAQSMRDLATSTIETHLAIASNRMNEIMKVLTVISTIFMPLSFVAGIYGMNFQFMPELSSRWAYPLVWLIFIGIAVSMLAYFRRRHWL
ncbi:MAG: magnesium/cobalt transporter CorA [Caldilineaceae bacterium]